MNDNSLSSTSNAPVKTTSASIAGAPIEGSAVDLRTSAVRKRRTSWILSLSGVCFIFGGLLAMQLRAVEQVEENRAQNVKGTVLAQEQNEKMRAKLEEEAKSRRESDARIAILTNKLATTGSLTQAQVKKLNTQIKEMQTLAGFTKVSGPGISLSVDDNPKAGTEDDRNFSPLMVHDFDLLQIVNELRSAKAEAISLNGKRLTNFTPIRCVGPTVLVNFEPIAAPFVIEAIGDQKTLEAALKLPGGIVDRLADATSGAGLQIKIARESSLTLPASESLPKLQNVQAN